MPSTPDVPIGSHIVDVICNPDDPTAPYGPWLGPGTVTGHGYTDDGCSSVYFTSDQDGYTYEMPNDGRIREYHA